MSFSFTQIPVDFRVPGNYVEVDGSQLGADAASVYPTRVLLMGQMQAPGAGMATPLTPQLLIAPQQAVTRFGRKSQLAQMAAAFLKADSSMEVWAVGIQDLGGGTQAAGAITFTGTATAAGTMPFYVGGKRYRVAVTTGMTAVQLATAMAAAITADPDAVATAAVDGDLTNSVDVTAVHKGLCGNDIDLRLSYYDDDALPAGITAVVTAMSGGAGNPDVTTALAVLGDTWFTDIVIPWGDGANLVALQTEMTLRYSALRMQDCIVWRALNGTVDALVTAGDARNSQFLFPIGWNKPLTPPWQTAAAVAAVCIRALTNDPARPVQTLNVPGILPPDVKDRFPREQRNLLLHHGISTLTADAGRSVYVERIVSEYQENALGADDTAWLNVEMAKTVSYLRYDLRTYFSRKYPRHKLAQDGTRFAAGQPIMTPKLGKAECCAKFTDWESRGLVQDFDRFKRELLVQLDTQDEDRLNFFVPPKCIRAFRVGAFLLQPR